MAATAVFRPRQRTGRAMLSFAAVLALSACAQNNANTLGASTSAPTGTIGPNTLNVADAAIAGGDPNMALSVSQSILANDPNNVDALVHEGDAYYALNRCPAAEAAYRLALKNDPHSSVAATGLGRCLLKTDPKGAEQAFMAAVQDDPGNADAYNDLGIARDLQGNFAGAKLGRLDYCHLLPQPPPANRWQIQLRLVRFPFSNLDLVFWIGRRPARVAQFSREPPIRTDTHQR